MIPKRVQYSRSGKRRFNARVGRLISLYERDDVRFRREWEKQVQGWLNEVHHRVKDWYESAEHGDDISVCGPAERGRARIFGVLDIAEALLAACGDEIEKLVGEETRRVLMSECVKAVATLCDGRLNYVVDHRLYRRSMY